MPKPDPLYQRVRAICLALPDTRETLTWGHPNFRVGDKIFASYGDEGTGEPCLGFKASPALQMAIDSDPRFFVAPYVGKHGWRCLRLRGRVSSDEIRTLVEASYQLIAPRRLAPAHAAGPTGDIHTQRWNDPPAHAGTTRILVCRYRPRGVRKQDETWDEWWQEMAPSRALHAAYWGKEGAPIGWAEYKRRYLAEMRAQRPRIEQLAARGRAGEALTLLCSSACTDPARCHRTLLARLISAASREVRGRGRHRAQGRRRSRTGRRPRGRRSRPPRNADLPRTAGPGRRRRGRGHAATPGRRRSAARRANDMTRVL